MVTPRSHRLDLRTCRHHHSGWCARRVQPGVGHATAAARGSWGAYPSAGFAPWERSEMEPARELPSPTPPRAGSGRDPPRLLEHDRGNVDDDAKAATRTHTRLRAGERRRYCTLDRVASPPCRGLSSHQMPTCEHRVVLLVRRRSYASPPPRHRHTRSWLLYTDTVARGWDRGLVDAGRDDPYQNVTGMLLGSFGGSHSGRRTGCRAHDVQIFDGRGEVRDFGASLLHTPSEVAASGLVPRRHASNCFSLEEEGEGLLKTFPHAH